MPSYVITKYSYCDIFIFYKTGKGYISLWDIDLSTLTIKDEEYCTFDDDSPILIALWNGKGYIISPVTISELISLSKLNNNSQFISQCHTLVGDNNEANVLIAIICAKNICNYHYGRITLKHNSRDLVYEFRRRVIVDGKRTYPIILEKSFRRANDG